MITSSEVGLLPQIVVILDSFKKILAFLFERCQDVIDDFRRDAFRFTHPLEEFLIIQKRKYFN